MAVRKTVRSNSSILIIPAKIFLPTCLGLLAFCPILFAAEFGQSLACHLVNLLRKGLTDQSFNRLVSVSLENFQDIVGGRDKFHTLILQNRSRFFVRLPSLGDQLSEMFFCRRSNDLALFVAETGHGFGAHHKSPVGVTVWRIGDERRLGEPLQDDGAVQRIEGGVDKPGLQR